jgi:membrane peptidoglycan carboxypeptidase
VYYNFFKKSLNIQGGSTITQQFVKNALLSPKRTYTRKIKELILSMEIEAMYSKDEILTMYLNEIPYGSNAYGVQAASEMYFGKNAKDLTLTEAALPCPNPLLTIPPMVRTAMLYIIGHSIVLMKCRSRAL